MLVNKDFLPWLGFWMAGGGLLTNTDFNLMIFSNQSSRSHIFMELQFGHYSACRHNVDFEVGYIFFKVSVVSDNFS